MQVKICIPARLNSSRFPKKVLADLNGKSVLQHVFERTCSCCDASDVFILTDSVEIRDIATGFGANVIETSDKCVSGTERIASVLNKIPGDFIINIQGDEPFFDTGIIDRMLSKAATSDADIFTPVFKFDNIEDVIDPNCVKVILNYSGRALYFSRGVLPYVRDEKDITKWLKYADYYGHVGIYGYRREVLEKYNDMVQGKLEFIEKLEQLRFLENGYSIDTVETFGKSIGIDTPVDLERAKELLRK